MEAIGLNGDGESCSSSAAAAKALKARREHEDGAAKSRSPRLRLKRARPRATSSGRTAVRKEAWRSCLERAASYLALYPPQVGRAQVLYAKALKLAPQVPEVLDAYGAFLCEQGDHDRAKELLQSSAKLQPEQGAEKFLYLAQMSSGEAALQHYRQGAAILGKALEKLQSVAAPAQGPSESATSSSSSAPAASLSKPRTEVERRLKQQLASAHAAIAELYMTDLCDLPDAEECCEAACEAGLKASTTCIELLAAKAMLRRVQGNLQESSELALQCASRICLTKREEGLDEDVDEEAAEVADDTCLGLARTLMEIDQPTKARELLTCLLDQNEEDIEVWLLLGHCHLLENDADGVEECAETGLELCDKLGDEGNDWRPNLKRLLEQAKLFDTCAAPEKASG